MKGLGRYCSLVYCCYRRINGAKQLGKRVKNVRKYVAQEFLDFMAECGRRVHAGLQAANTNAVVSTNGVFATKVQQREVILPGLRRVTPLRQRRGQTWIFGFTTPAQLWALIPAIFLRARWESQGISSKVLCTEEHPVYIRCNTGTNKINVHFAFEARNDSDGSLVISRVQKLNS